MSCNRCENFSKELCCFNENRNNPCRDCLTHSGILDQRVNLRKECFNDRYSTNNCNVCIQREYCESENGKDPFRTTREEERKQATSWHGHGYITIEVIQENEGTSTVNLEISIDESKFIFENIDCKIIR